MGPPRAAADAAAASAAGETGRPTAAPGVADAAAAALPPCGVSGGFGEVVGGGEAGFTATVVVEGGAGETEGAWPPFGGG